MKEVLVMRTIMIEPVGGDCNLSCKYCYHESIKKKGEIRIMPLHILKKTIKDALESTESGRIKFLWHGGEPMLAGLGFFEAVVAYQKELNYRNLNIVNAIQTNCTLLNEKWARFLSKNNFYVGTSIDGPKWLHDKIRARSYDNVINGIRILQEFSSEVGIIITISKENVEFHNEIWYEIILPKSLSKNFDLNVCSASESRDLSPSCEESFRFLAKIFNLWAEEDDPEIHIKIFRIVLRYLMSGKSLDCAFEYGKCNKFAAVDEKGNVYICNRFIKRPVAYLGNILDKRLNEILASNRASTLYKQISRIKKECRKCQWLNCCGGGCAFQRWVSRGRFDDGYPECELRKRFFDYVKKSLVL